MSLSFEWNEFKSVLNDHKHGVDFYFAQKAFFDPNRIIAVDLSHSTASEKRYYCFGKVGSEILTVRFTYREDRIRIFGAGFWRKGKKQYEQAQKNKVY